MQIFALIVNAQKIMLKLFRTTIMIKRHHDQQHTRNNHIVADITQVREDSMCLAQS